MATKSDEWTSCGAEVLFVLARGVAIGLCVATVAGFTNYLLHVDSKNIHAVISQLEDQLHEAETVDQRADIIISQACEIFYEPSTEEGESFKATFFTSGTKRAGFDYYSAEFSELSPVDANGVPTDLESVMNEECPGRVQVA